MAIKVEEGVTPEPEDPKDPQRALRAIVGYEFHAGQVVRIHMGRLTEERVPMDEQVIRLTHHLGQREHYRRELRPDDRTDGNGVTPLLRARAERDVNGERQRRPEDLSNDSDRFRHKPNR